MASVATIVIGFGLLVTATGCPGKRRPSGPTADCGEVAESLVSIELGNYAPPEQRAALVPAKRAECERLRITIAEADCLAKASDRWSAAACVPRMFPEVEASGCEPVVAKMRALITSQMGGDRNLEPMVGKLIGIIGQSCAEDDWPAPFRACILAIPAGNLAAMSECEKAMPPGLKDKIDRRVRAMTP